MKIFDCTTFYSENLMLEVRFNILDKYVDKFVIVEGKYSHSGEKKKLNFDIKKFTEFKKKIIYSVVENEPENLIYKKKDNKLIEDNVDMRNNSIKRIAYQRNSLSECINEANNEDYIFYSDNDEIPNFENINLNDNSSKIIIFKQKLFYYKFNLLYENVDWYGTKGCKKSLLQSFSWLREVKAKKYPFYRIDTLLSNNKYRNVKIINNGGWHFTQLKTPEDLEKKLMNQEHHDEYKLAKDNLPNVSDLIKRKTIIYDYKAKSHEYKFSKEFKLKTVSMDYMPQYLKVNKNKYLEWFDTND
jgi:beta-1,4-mannosyl-glycoprotein beta-1,4-N-acetylglucosaminyltransferase